MQSRIAHVTVYASGARVRRTTTVAAAGRLRFTDLPVAVIDDTVRVEVDGGPLATAVVVGVSATEADAAADEEPAAVRAARRRVALATVEVERVDAALAALAQAPVAVDDPSEEPPPAWGAVVAARRTIVALRAERELAVREQAAAARREVEEAQRALAAALDKDRRAGGARPQKLHELRKHVDVELTGSGGATVHLEYQIAAARWAPSYVARLDGDRVAFELRAVVAQDSGEDWTSVPLALSTAEPARFAVLPELAAQRIGRRQQEPGRAGFRAPPTGADALFMDYLRAFPARDVTRPVPSTTIELPRGGIDQLATEVWDEGSSRAKDAFQTPPLGKPMPQPAAPGAMPAPARARTLVGAVGGGGFGDELKKRASAPRNELAADAPAPPPPPAPTARLDYGNLRMAPPSSLARGTLVPAAPDRHLPAIDGELAASIARITTLVLPPGCRADWAHTYDYAFATDGSVDVRSDAAWHSIAVTAANGTARLRHVAVPREQADAFRIATIANPLGGPLLPGPVDVYDRGRFLVTSEVDYTPPGAPVEIGLGVDPQVKIARNTEFREESSGVLRGALRLHHAIAIDVENLSARAIDLEVRERIPVIRDGDDDVEVTIGRVDPAWERWTPDPDAPRDQRLRGGYRWRLAIPAGAKRALRVAYEVKIAGKLELVGGNRREA